MLCEIYHAMLRCAVPRPALVWVLCPALVSVLCYRCTMLCHAVLCNPLLAVFHVTQDMLLVGSTLTCLTCILTCLTGRFFVSMILGCKKAAVLCEAHYWQAIYLSHRHMKVCALDINRCRHNRSHLCALTQHTEHSWQQNCGHTSLLRPARREVCSVGTLLPMPCTQPRRWANGGDRGGQ